jgi:hypothetical protein
MADRASPPARAHARPWWRPVTGFLSPGSWVVVGAVALWLLWRRERFLLVTLSAYRALTR